MDDEEWIEAEMDEYFHQQPDEEYIDPNDYSYVDPQTGLTPKQQAYLEYRQAWDDYEANWIGTPYMDRTEDPPRWEDFWQEPTSYQRPNRQYQYQPQYSTPKTKRTKGEKIAIIIAASLFFIALVELIITLFI